MAHGKQKIYTFAKKETRTTISIIDFGKIK